MSLLEQITRKRQNLAECFTVVTTTEGRRFLETKSNRLVEVSRAEYGFIVDTKPDNIPAQVLPNIFLGSQDCIELPILSEHKINAVLSVGVDAPLKYENIKYKFVECLDLPETNLKKCLIEDCVAFIDSCVNVGENLLVHCNAGVSRSPAIVIGYLIVKKGFSYQEAHDLVKNVRSCVKPNEGFVKTLKSL